MQIPEELTGAGLGGWMGWIAAAAVSGVMFFRRIWHVDLVSGANSRAAVDAIQRLYDLLDAERRDKALLQAQLADANVRADRAYAERNEAIRELGEIKAELAALRAEVRLLRERHGNAD